jgi:DnaJ-class molecular chaperone
MAKWVGDRPKKNRDRRLLLINILQRLMYSANVEYEKSKQPGRKVVTEYRPEKCPECAGKRKRGRARCKACKGKGQGKRILSL